jgi:hypothetical protein
MRGLNVMEKKFMIIRIEKIISRVTDELMLTEPCYQIVEKDFKSPSEAYEVKEKYSEPQLYIVVEYWT